jgi:hypothetical protein
VAAVRCGLRLLREDVLGDQLPQAVRQDVARDAQVVAEVREAADAEERLADDEERPPVPDEVEGAGDRARHRVEALRDTTRILAGWVASRNLGG